MAKIFRTETLSLNADYIRLTADSEDNFEFKDSSGSVLMSKASIESNISSLQAQRVADEATNDEEISSLAALNSAGTDGLTEDISSLQAQRVADEATNDEEISSLQAQRVADEATNDEEISSLQAQRDADEAANDEEISSLHAQRDADEAANDEEISSLHAQRVADEAANDEEISSLHAQRVADEAANDEEISSLAALNSEGTDGLIEDISSLQAQRVTDESTNDEEISSLAASITTNDVVAVSSGTISSGASSVTVSFGRTFSSTPTVVGVLKGDSSDPIIGMYMTSVSNTEAVFEFADDLPSGNYTVEVLASI